MFSFLDGLQWTWNTLALVDLLALAALWGLFEWRVRSENKPFMRLAALGTLALAMTVVTMITAGSIELPFFLQLPAMGRFPRPRQSGGWQQSTHRSPRLSRRRTKKDWYAAKENADRDSKAIGSLSTAAGMLNREDAGGRAADSGQIPRRLRRQMNYWREAQEAIRDKDTERLRTAMRKFHEVYGPVGEMAR